MSASFFDEVFGQAKDYFIKGNYKTAEPLLQQLIMQHTRNPEVYQMLATIFYDRGQFNKAIKTFQRALEIDPSYTDASVGLSIILNDLGKYEEGKQVFQDAKKLLDQRKGKLDPYTEEKLASKHEELADLYFQYKMYSEALDQLLRAYRLTTRKADIVIRISDCYAQIPDFEKATKELKNFLKDYPQSTQVRMKLGWLYYNMKNLAEATEQWERVLMREPNHAEALRCLKMAQTAGVTTLL